MASEPPTETIDGNHRREGTARSQPSRKSRRPQTAATTQSDGHGQRMAPTPLMARRCPAGRHAPRCSRRDALSINRARSAPRGPPFKPPRGHCKTRRCNARNPPPRTYPRLQLEPKLPHITLLSAHYATNQPHRYAPPGGMLFSRKLRRLYNLSERTLPWPWQSCNHHLAVSNNCGFTICASTPWTAIRPWRHLQKATGCWFGTTCSATFEPNGSLQCAASRSTPDADHHQSAPQRYEGQHANAYLALQDETG